ncbi:MAG: amidohydrolase family protein [Chitinophagaceae bacterium]|nr:amidohydrolase family protein [Chitinophagaceae bacterium]
MRILQRCFIWAVCVLLVLPMAAQPTFPVNGVANPNHGYFAFTNATIVQDALQTITNGTMIIKDGKILSIGKNVQTPAGAVEVDCSGKYIYPSFIDIYTDYGVPQPKRQSRSSFSQGQQLFSDTKGAYGWNEAIKPGTEAFKDFSIDNDKAESFRKLGFGTVLSHVEDGIARGTGVLVTLANTNDNFVMLKERASAHYSFSKGISTQSYPSSLMGDIALLRQTYLDAAWYKQKPVEEGTNLSLQAWNNNQPLPQIFEANDKWNDLRADRIGDEFGVQYIIKAGVNEYQRMDDIKATNATFILPLNFPKSPDVSDPEDAATVSLSELKNWEMAPSNPAAFEKAGIPFCLTTADLPSTKMFWTHLQKAMLYGLSAEEALKALTATPAATLGIDNLVGSLQEGKLANFLITSGPIFDSKTEILDNYIQGHQYEINPDASTAGSYRVTILTAKGDENYTLEVKNSKSATLIGKDSLDTKFEQEGKKITIRFSPGKKESNTKKSMAENAVRLSGLASGQEWSGIGIDTLGNSITWTATLIKKAKSEVKKEKKEESPTLGKVFYPFEPYGWEEGKLPQQETILIQHATIWTNENEGVLTDADLLIKDGKIAAIGKNLKVKADKIIDGTGKHLTPGIIDEHSHIATASVNEGGQSVTSEVRIGDNLNPEDINIYRQLSGGVTTSHILHGSANTIGGQTQLIKLRWGVDDEGLKFKGAAPFIKFALGENVKQSRYNVNTRYPVTRMGVQEVLIDAFTRAKDYRKSWQEYNEKMKRGIKTAAPRKDLELDALVEILEKKRFITCHSYVQSELKAAMEVGDKMGYTVNTFTHVLEGYKVADKLLKHGANVSTFSDWWAYKMEVMDAIPYNAAIMQKMGLNVAINSDDAEMARRLNQEAAKTIKYGGVTEEQALKMVTLNPAKMLHVENRVGSLKVGKDGDVVLWSDNPLSIYAKPLYTIIEGTIYFDRQTNEEKMQEIKSERQRIILKILNEKKKPF